MEIEQHPLEPFLPGNARLLMLGSFPPQRKRWSMEFYYPNWNNDMWRIAGLLFFNDKDHFADKSQKAFRKERIIDFLNEKGIALFDTATAVRRLQDNASDKYLEVVRPTDISALLQQLPQCKAIVTTGQKATDTLCALFSLQEPKVGLKLVYARAMAMQKACEAQPSTMAAIIALPDEKVEEICAQVSSEGEVCVAANYNCPGQIVISGKKAAVEEACEKLKAAGAKRAIMLNVSGPFHSGMLVGAGEKLGKVLENVEIHKPVIPYAANVTAQYVTEAEPVKDLLVKQVSSSVKWQQCVETMLADGVDTFIEIGPGKTLAGFMRKIDRSVKTLNVEKLEDIEKVVEALKEA